MIFRHAADFPAVPSPAAAPSTGAAIPRSILIIEDNVDGNELMAMLLGLEGHNVTSSFDGVDGLRLALAGTFDIVLCDLGLPRLGGLEIAAAVTTAMGGAAPMMIATTGYSDNVQRDLARAAGFDLYLVKPVDLASLSKAIADYPTRRGPSP